MDFDPYGEWLQIPAHRRPPSHYDLLSVTLFESDESIIRRAAMARSAEVNKYRLGQRGAIAIRLLGEIATALACLTDDERKAAYDVELRRQLRPVPLRGATENNASDTAPTEQASPTEHDADLTRQAVAEPDEQLDEIEEIEEIDEIDEVEEVEEDSTAIENQAAVAGPGYAPTAPQVADGISIRRRRPLRRRGWWATSPVWLRVAVVLGPLPCLLLAAYLMWPRPYGTIELALSNPYAKVTVTVDGKRVRRPRPGMMFSLPAGEHQLEVAGPGYKTISRTFVVAPGKNPLLPITLKQGEPDGASKPGADSTSMWESSTSLTRTRSESRGCRWS